MAGSTVAYPQLAFPPPLLSIHLEAQRNWVISMASTTTPPPPPPPPPSLERQTSGSGAGQLKTYIKSARGIFTNKDLREIDIFSWKTMVCVLVETALLQSAINFWETL